MSWSAGMLRATREIGTTHMIRTARMLRATGEIRPLSMIRTSGMLRLAGLLNSSEGGGGLASFFFFTFVLTGFFGLLITRLPAADHRTEL